jgi:acyl carrier protein
MLRVEQVQPDDDFFELGGTSLMVAEAVEELGRRLRMELPMLALFEAPTPSEMIEVIAELREEQAAFAGGATTPFFPDWVTMLQRHGTGRPVFLFPGGMGGKWILARDAQVAALVGRHHPFYGFRRDRPHIDPRRGDWITAMAAAYVEQMRTIQGDGPFLIYAVCSGGVLAWESVKLLLAAGEEVAGVLFYEAPLRSNFAAPTSNGAQLGTSPLGHIQRYIPERLPVDLTVLESHGWRAQGRSAGWRQVVGGRLAEVAMPGESSGMHEPYRGRVTTVAEHIRAWIERSEARLPGA